jgi:hypothetical protein
MNRYVSGFCNHRVTLYIETVFNEHHFGLREEELHCSHAILLPAQILKVGNPAELLEKEVPKTATL